MESIQNKISVIKFHAREAENNFKLRRLAELEKDFIALYIAIQKLEEYI